MSEEEYLTALHNKYILINRLSEQNDYRKLLKTNFTILTTYQREGKEFLDRETWELTRKGY